MRSPGLAYRIFDEERRDLAQEGMGLASPLDEWGRSPIHGTPPVARGLEFDGPPEDAVPPDYVTIIGQKQDDAIRKRAAPAKGD